MEYLLVCGFFFFSVFRIYIDFKCTFCEEFRATIKFEAIFFAPMTTLISDTIYIHERFPKQHEVS